MTGEEEQEGFLYFRETVAKFFELTLHTKAAASRHLVLQALFTSKQAVQVLSWLKDSDQDLIGLGSNSSGSDLMRRRDAPLVERDLKLLEH